MKKTSLFIFLIGIVVILPMVLLPVEVLSVHVEDQIKYIFTMSEGDHFSIRWIHSVEEEEWEEFFRIHEGNIYLDSTRFKTFGAGVPNNVGSDSYLEDGWLYMIEIDRFIGDLYIRAGSTTNHRLFINDQAYLLSQPKQETAYYLKVENNSLFQYLYQFVLVNMGWKI